MHSRKVLAVYIVLVSFSSLNATQRPYVSSENDAFKYNYMVYEDENGELHFEYLNKLNMKEKSVSLNEIDLYLYTRQNPVFGLYISLDQNAGIEELQKPQFYNSSKPNYFIIHGWKNHYKSPVSVILREAVLKWNDINVFVVNWGRIAKNSYSSCYLRVTEIGKHIASFIINMTVSFQISLDMFRIAGYSMGAHIAGRVGYATNGSLNYIVGLDPAGPHFSDPNDRYRLDKTNANFVQVIHTSGNFPGYAEALGHADYFPNGGMRQTGCTLDLLGTCSHGRSYMYLAESLVEGGFVSTKCSNFELYNNGLCGEGHKSYLGRCNIDKSATGNYFLDTNGQPPYSQD